MAAWGMGFVLLGSRCQAAPSSAQFDLTQRQEAQGTNVTITAKVWIKGDRVRMEMKNPLTGDFLVISDGKNVYKLLPAQKAGQKSPAPSVNGKPISPWQLVTTDVNRLRGEGKKVGRETIEGVGCDVYSASKSSKDGNSASFKAWIGSVSGVPIPMKVVIKHSMVKPGATMTGIQTLAITHLKTNIAIADTQFAVPKDYKIATGPSGSPMPGLPHPGKP
jgi:outer membrane lipoprotein-sorting protein